MGDAKVILMLETLVMISSSSIDIWSILLSK